MIVSWMIMMMIRMVSVRTMIEIILMLMMTILVIMTRIANSKDRVSVNEKLYNTPDKFHTCKIKSI